MSNLKQIMTLTFLFLSLCLSACTKPIQDVSIKTETSSAISEPSIIKPSEENSMQGSDVSKNTTNEHITQVLSSGVEVDADILIPASMQKSELPEMFGRGHVIDQNLVASVFFEGEKSPEKQTEEFKDFSMFSKDSVYSTWTLEKERLTISGTSANFSNGRNEVGYYLFSEFPTSLPFGDNRVTYLSGENLEFSTIDEAKSQIQKYVNSLGISVLEPTCYTMDYDTMRAVYDGRTALETYDADFDFIIEPQKKDEQYIFDYPIAVNGMPLGNFEGGGYSDDSYMTGTFLRMTYGEEGIRAMTLPYALDVTEVGAMQPVLTLDEALQIVDDKYNSIIMEGNYKIDKIEMAYTPIQQQNVTEAKIIPVWRFQTNHTLQYSAKNDSNEIVEMTDTRYILINALDGTELLHSNGDI